MVMWRVNDNCLTNEFEFENFQEALVFVNRIAELAEIRKHHPDIFIHDYRFVKISLTTHDAGNKISEKDAEMAPMIDALYTT